MVRTPVNPFGAVNVCVSYICPDMIHADFSDSLNDMIVHSMSIGIQTSRSRVRSTLLEIGRGVQVEQALRQRGMTHILFVDSDMKFPCDTLERLLVWKESIIGCTYSQRISPRAPTHRDLDGECKIPAPQWSHKDPQKFEVKSLGLGCVLINLNTFRRIPRPWFRISYEQDDQGKQIVMPDGSDKHISEDNAFFARARDAGYHVFCDWSLSQVIQHVGTFSFGMEHVEIMTGQLPV